MIRVAEDFQTFSCACGHRGSTNSCKHPNKINPICLEKKYCPRVATVANRQRQKPDWCMDYNLYCATHEIEYNKLISSTAWIHEREEIHPDIDVLRSMRKARDFWLSESGWKKKIMKHQKTIDWNRTYKNALSQNWNQVAKSKSGAWV